MAWTAEPSYPDPDARLRAAVARWRAAVDPDELRRLVEALPAPRNRLHAPEAMAAADELISGGWRAAGWAVERQELDLRDVRARLDHPGPDGGRYPAHTYQRLVGANLIATLPGDRPDAIVFVAHHDTVRDSPGADDNGAAVAVLLQLARFLGGRRFARTIVLAAPDFEELGLVGSRHLVRRLTERHPVRAAVVFDAVAYMDRTPGSQRVPSGIGRFYPGQRRRLRERQEAGDTLVAIHRADSTALARAWARCLAAAIGRDRVLLLRDPTDLPVIGRVGRLIPAARDFSRSDHVRFWQAGIPAIHVSDTGDFRDPHYHRPSDTPDTLDYETLADVVAASAALIERVGGAPATRGR